MLHENYTDINASTIDGWVAEGWEWSTPTTPEEFARAKVGLCEDCMEKMRCSRAANLDMKENQCANCSQQAWRVLLTPQKAVPAAWFEPCLQNGRLNGTKLLGLASGGGQQMPIFAALGADCTVLDYSPAMLELERMVAQREGYDINIVRADMTKCLPFDDASFDLIFHPVSNCYVEDVHHVWRECYRVLKPGGVLLVGMDDNPLQIANKLPFNPLKDEALRDRLLANDDGFQFSHTMEEQLGGQLQAGLVLTHLYEDSDGEGIGEYMPNFIATRAVRPK